MRLLQEKRITFAEYNEGIGLNYHESATLIRLGIGVALFFVGNSGCIGVFALCYTSKQVKQCFP